MRNQPLAQIFEGIKMKIEIITSVNEGLGEEPVLKIDGKPVKNFDWYHFDWDVYDFEDKAFNGGQDNITEDAAFKLHAKMTGGK